MKVKNSKIVQDIRQIEMNQEDIIKICSYFNINFDDWFKKSKSVKIYMNVPGGGDYSNCQLEVDNDNKLIIEIEGSLSQTNME